jgi:anti-sigma regulatory factor (Ser/Thr protein kinase)
VKVLVTLTTAWDRVKVNVIDGGRKPMPESLPDKPDIREDFRGMGMFLIKELVDEVEIKSQPGRNEIQMIIYLEK